jgi:hypothetical protein
VYSGLTSVTSTPYPAPVLKEGVVDMWRNHAKVKEFCHQAVLAAAGVMPEILQSTGHLLIGMCCSLGLDTSSIDASPVWCWRISEANGWDPQS